MTIIYFGHYELKEGSASTIHVREIVNNLRKLGLNVKIIAKEAEDKLNKELKPVLIPFLPFKGFRILSFSFLANCFLFFFSRKFAPAIIYYRRMLLDPFPALVSRLSGAPLIIELNEIVKPHIRELLPYWFWKIILNSFEKILIHQSYAVICPSETMGEYYKVHYPKERNKFCIVAHGVNLERFKPINKIEAQKELGIPQGRYLLWAGTAFWWSGLQFLFELGKELSKQNSQTKVLVIGEGKELNKLKYLVEKKNLENHFFFLPQLPYEKMVFAYSSAFLLLAPYDYSYLTVRGFPFKIVESLACATPVMTLRAPVSEEINNLLGGLILVENYNAEKWVEEIEKLTQNLVEIQSVGERSREAIIRNNLTWYSAAEKIASVIRSI